MSISNLFGGLTFVFDDDDFDDDDFIVEAIEARKCAKAAQTWDRQLDEWDVMTAREFGISVDESGKPSSWGWRHWRRRVQEERTLSDDLRSYTPTLPDEPPTSTEPPQLTARFLARVS